MTKLSFGVFAFTTVVLGLTVLHCMPLTLSGREVEAEREFTMYLDERPGLRAGHKMRLRASLELQREWGRARKEERVDKGDTDGTE